MLPFHGRRTQGQAEMRRDMGMGMGMGWGMWKRYGHGDGPGWGICYSDIKGQHKDKHTCVIGMLAVRCNTWWSFIW